MENSFEKNNIMKELTFVNIDEYLLKSDENTCVIPIGANELTQEDRVKFYKQDLSKKALELKRTVDDKDSSEMDYYRAAGRFLLAKERLDNLEAK